MTKCTRLRLAALAGSTLVTLALTDTSEAKVTVDVLTINAGNTTILLERTSQYYVDAMRRLIALRYPQGHVAIRWERLEQTMRALPVARIEYRFLLNGIPQIRVYNAMGGAPLSDLGKRVFEGPVTVSTDSSGSGSASDDAADAPARVQEGDLAAVDADDSAFFRGFNEVEVRAPILAGDDSVMTPFRIEGRDGSLDPEFKALRAIEADLKSGRVPSGGTLRGSVSAATCESCRLAMDALSRSYDIDVHMTQMFGSVPRAEQARLIDTGVARLQRGMLVNAETGEPLLAMHALRAAREGQVRRSLGSRPMRRSVNGMTWQSRSFILDEGPVAGSGDTPPASATSPDHDVLERAEPDC